MTDATYKGECRLKRWADSPQGMTVTVQLDDGPDGYTVHPFKDHTLGSRFAVMFVPINDDESLGKRGDADNAGSSDQAPDNTDRAQEPAALAAGVPAATAAPKPGISAASKPKRKWHELSPSQQAAILCGQLKFMTWLGASNITNAAENVRARCGVDSRRKLDTHDDCRAAWERLLASYEADTGRRAEDRS